MRLSNKESQFIIQRTKLIQTWHPVGIFILVVLLAFCGWLFAVNPLLINPFIVIFRLKNDSIPFPTLTLMASFLPIAVLMCFFLVFIIILFLFVSFANEKKYLNIIQKIISK